MHLVYATEQRERDFKIAEEPGEVPTGARVYATCTPVATTENVGEITFQGMTDQEYYELKAMVREARERARAEQSEAEQLEAGQDTANKPFNFFSWLFTR
jgi:hypothetical protein